MVFLVRRERIAGVCATPWKRGSIAEIKSQRIMEAIHEQPNDRAIDPRDHLAYAPKWARDPATAERRNSAGQRFASTLDEHDFFGSDTAEPFLVDESEAIEGQRGLDWRVMAGLLAAGSVPGTVLTIWVL